MYTNFREQIYKIKQWVFSIFIYPKMRPHDGSYNRYWEDRKLQDRVNLNSFQKKRADIVLKTITAGSVFLDIGCGNGGVLAYINEKKKMKRLIGVDVSGDALELAKKKGIETIQADLSELKNMNDLPQIDYIILFEILEHIANSEDLLGWAVNNARKIVFFSFPNTGFITHRLRLLLGRFPLQWKLHPSEHLRYWTVRDLKWWLGQLGYKNYNLTLYEGIPFLNKIWPSLFTQGIFVQISK